jgi:hypothetical protein
MSEKENNKTCASCKYYQNTGFPQEYLCGKTIEWFNTDDRVQKAMTCEYYSKKSKGKI